MYKRTDEETGEVREEYKEGLWKFMGLVANQEITREQGMTVCPCIKCENEKVVKVDLVWRHLYNRGFTLEYYIWLSHGEDLANMPGISRRVGRVEGSNIDRIVEEDSTTIRDNVEGMIRDRFPEVVETSNIVQSPNPESRRFFEMLEAAKHPIYDGCKEGHSPLSAATRMMRIKTNFNLTEDCVDAFADMFYDYLPEGNLAPRSYYAIQKLVAGLGLPYQIIDVCRDNCMIFWREDANLESCRFCGLAFLINECGTYQSLID